MLQPRTSIVATVGPACETEVALAQLIEAGVDVLRLNFSHGTLERHAEAIERIHRLRARTDRPVAIMQDLQGPRIRTGRLQGGQPVQLVPEDTVVIAPGDFEGDKHRIATGYAGLARDVVPGNTILLCDGTIELNVTAVDGEDIVCRVVAGGELGERKGMNLPGVDVSLRPPTDKDLADLAFGVEHGVDYVALSFVRSGEDVARLREELDRLGAADTPVIAKIERPEAVADIGAILARADGLMVARGDLGIEMPTENVPTAQKHIIAAANKACVPVITATQMLDSMVHSRRPTRAEASDVANAILDGTDAVMLSAETAIGQYPVRAVEMMRRIAGQAERLLAEQPIRRGVDLSDAAAVRQQALASAACEVTERLAFSGVVAFTMTGATARYLSQRRPAFPIYALTPVQTTFRRLALIWGVQPVLFHVFDTTDEMIERGEARLLELGLAGVGDTMVCMAGGSTNTPGGTDMLKIHYFDGKSPYA